LKTIEKWEVDDDEDDDLEEIVIDKI